MFDNSNLQQKIRIRRKGISEHPNMNYDKILELYSGEGNLSKFWIQITKKLICVEKEKSNLDKIKIDNVEKFNVDNKSKAILELSKDIQIIDCDAYGKVVEQLKCLLNVSTTDKLIFFTDGTLKQEKKHKRNLFLAEIANLKTDNIYYEKAIGANVYYGYIYYKTSN